MSKKNYPDWEKDKRDVLRTFDGFLDDVISYSQERENDIEKLQEKIDDLEEKVSELESDLSNVTCEVEDLRRKNERLQYEVERLILENNILKS